MKNIFAELNRNPMVTGDYERAAFGTGQISALVRGIKPIGAIIDEMVS